MEPGSDQQSDRSGGARVALEFVRADWHLMKTSSASLWPARRPARRCSPPPDARIARLRSRGLVRELHMHEPRARASRGAGRHQSLVQLICEHPLTLTREVTAG